jgi:hypothetical protein
MLETDCKAEKVGQVAAQVERATQLSGDLFRIVEEVEGRLGCVLVSQESPKEPDGERASLVSLAGLIESNNDQFDRSIFRLRSVLDRLEL